MHGFGSRKHLANSICGKRLLTTRSIAEQFTVSRLLQATLQVRGRADYVLVWGRKPSGRNLVEKAHRSGLPVIYVEDGFIRSFGTGPHFPALSLVVDWTGIYYDATAPSDLEGLLNGDEDLDTMPDIDRAINRILADRLSKYNHAPQILSADLSLTGRQRVLVLDQTFGDLSVTYGGANHRTFNQMLQASIEENPGAHVYIKTHPEVISGHKRGYLSDVKDQSLPAGGKISSLRMSLNPIGLLDLFDKVYVVTSGMGFEALLCGKSVRCFGLPWYAGWGVTTDEQLSHRRKRARSVREMFAAAYFRYTRYLNPVTYELGSIFDVMTWIRHQRAMSGLL